VSCQLRKGIPVSKIQDEAYNDQGSLFGPYTPLQQLDVLADYGTKSYIVGSTNSLLLQQRDRYSDILINVSHFFRFSLKCFPLNIGKA
jgi:hypothetical protein